MRGFLFGRRSWPDEDPDPADPREARLVDECTAFLTGGYPWMLLHEGNPVPAWAWVNLLAHASEPVLTALTAGGWPRVRAPEVWKSAVSRLAGQCLDLAARLDVELHDLQVTVLVPLELALIAEGVENLGPSRLVERVESALIRAR